MKDKIDKKEINLMYCPTSEMIADFFSKPQQGQKFRNFRDVIMGVTHHSSIRALTSQGQERVENMDLERLEDSKLVAFPNAHAEEHSVASRKLTHD
jgi:hypothetical protein